MGGGGRVCGSTTLPSNCEAVEEGTHAVGNTYERAGSTAFADVSKRSKDFASGSGVTPPIVRAWSPKFNTAFLRALDTCNRSKADSCNLFTALDPEWLSTAQTSAPNPQQKPQKEPREPRDKKQPKNQYQQESQDEGNESDESREARDE